MQEKLTYFKDSNFKFDEATHTYTYVDNREVVVYDSVTHFLSQFKKPFNSDYIAYCVAKKRETTKAIVLNEWKEISDTALVLGTNVHKWIEDFYNKKNPQMPLHEEEKKRVEKFLSIYEEKLHKLTPIHQELRIFSKKWKLAGTIDCLFNLTEYNFVGDWKTNKKFTTDSDIDGRRQKLLWPFDDMWDNSLNSYSIQTSLYRLILQEEADYKTDGAFLCWIGPHEKPKIYKSVDVRERLYNFLQKNGK